MFLSGDGVGTDRFEELHRDVRFAIAFKIGRRLRPLTDTERDVVATAIVEHIKLCNWRVDRGPPLGGFSYLGSGPPKAGHGE
jgi:hypothetical protein